MVDKHLPWNPGWLADVWIRLGAVVWRSQFLEDAIAKFIVLVFEMKDDDARDIALDVLTENKKLTLVQTW